MQRKIEEAFTKRFGRSPRWTLRAPGRVNLIGEHTDYNDGYVLPMAIDRSIWMSISPRSTKHVRLFSLDFDQEVQVDLTDLKQTGQGWIEYVKGMAWVLEVEGYPLRGWEGVVSGTIPIGAGLSSSAALELASARAFSAAAGLNWDPIQMAKLGQKAENEWVGVQCGIMDQLISAAGKAEHALLIDCRTLETQAVPLPPEIQVIVMDTGTRRGLVDSAYNERRVQCEQAARLLSVPSLRDISERVFQEKIDSLDDVVKKRARHVITENDRVLKAVEAMERGDAQQLGELMNQSHDSLRDDFEVSSPALDAIVGIAQQQRGCFGARMTGAGFGGCGVAIVGTSAVDNFLSVVGQQYTEMIGHHSKLYVCHAADGADIIAFRPPGKMVG